MDAKPGAKMYCGFTRDITAQEFYDRCKNCTVEEVLNVMYPKKGDVIYLRPGTVHAADGGLLIAEIQESSDMTFRLYDWGREFNPATARKTHLEEAIDVIDYRAFDAGMYRKGPLWGEEASYAPCKSCDCGPECDCGDDCHCHEGHEHAHEAGPVEVLVEVPQFNVTKLNLKDPLHIYTEQFESFIVYMCLQGAASIQVPSVKENGEQYMENYEFSKGETILVPAEMEDFYLVPRDPETMLLEAVTRPAEALDEYIDPDTEAFLEGEDYEGLEDGAFDDGKDPQPKGASPLKFFS
jgi:mannose-6-phosphate isomerase